MRSPDCTRATSVVVTANEWAEEQYERASRWLAESTMELVSELLQPLQFRNAVILL